MYLFKGMRPRTDEARVIDGPRQIRNRSGSGPDDNEIYRFGPSNGGILHTKTISVVFVEAGTGSERGEC